MRDSTVTDEVRDYAAGHGSRPAGDGVHRLRSKTQALGDVAGMQIGDTHVVRTSRWRRARLSARAKPLDVTPERWSPRCCGRTPSKFRFDGSPLKEAEEVQRKTTLDRGRTLNPSNSAGHQRQSVVGEPQGPQRPRTF